MNPRPMKDYKNWLDLQHYSKHLRNLEEIKSRPNTNKYRSSTANGNRSSNIKSKRELTPTNNDYSYRKSSAYDKTINKK